MVCKILPASSSPADIVTCLRQPLSPHPCSLSIIHSGKRSQFPAELAQALTSPGLADGWGGHIQLRKTRIDRINNGTIVREWERKGTTRREGETEMDLLSQNILKTLLSPIKNPP